MATAATPLTAIPIKIRVVKKNDQIGSKALRINKMAAKNKAKTIIGLRPKRSEIKPVKSKPIAKATVENDNGKLLWVGVTVKKSAKIGIIGCTQYKVEKEVKPARNNEKRMALNGLVPY